MVTAIPLRDMSVNLENVQNMRITNRDASRYDYDGAKVSALGQSMGQTKHAPVQEPRARLA
jgi:hypothetical protein